MPQVWAQPAVPELLQHPLLHDTRQDRIEPWLDHVRVRTVAKGALLHTPGTAGALHLVVQGRLRAYQLTAGGRKLVLEIIPAGGVDGLLPLLGQRGHFTEAAEDSKVASLDWKTLEQLFVVEPRIMRTLFDLIASRLESREEHLEWMMIRDPTQRLARQLSALASAVGEPESDQSVAIPRSITHQLLADMIGIRRETVTLHLHHLAELGAVDIHGRQLIVRPRELEIMAARPEE